MGRSTLLSFIVFSLTCTSAVLQTAEASPSPDNDNLQKELWNGIWDQINNNNKHAQEHNIEAPTPTPPTEITDKGPYQKQDLEFIRGIIHEFKKNNLFPKMTTPVTKPTTTPTTTTTTTTTTPATTTKPFEAVDDNIDVIKLLEFLRQKKMHLSNEQWFLLSDLIAAAAKSETETQPKKSQTNSTNTATPVTSTNSPNPKWTTESTQTATQETTSTTATTASISKVMDSLNGISKQQWARLVETMAPGIHRETDDEGKGDDMAMSSMVTKKIEDADSEWNNMINEMMYPKQPIEIDGGNTGSPGNDWDHMREVMHKSHQKKSARKEYTSDGDWTRMREFMHKSHQIVDNTGRPTLASSPTSINADQKTTVADDINKIKAKWAQLAKEVMEQKQQNANDNGDEGKSSDDWWRMANGLMHKSHQIKNEVGETAEKRVVDVETTEKPMDVLLREDNAELTDKEWDNLLEDMKERKAPKLSPMAVDANEMEMPADLTDKKHKFVLDGNFFETTPKGDKLANPARKETETKLRALDGSSTNSKSHEDKGLKSVQISNRFLSAPNHDKQVWSPKYDTQETADEQWEKLMSSGILAQPTSSEMPPSSSPRQETPSIGTDSPSKTASASSDSSILLERVDGIQGENTKVSSLVLAVGGGIVIAIALLLLGLGLCLVCRSKGWMCWKKEKHTTILNSDGMRWDPQAFRPTKENMNAFLYSIPMPMEDMTKTY